jgi:hypothetical protein
LKHEARGDATWHGLADNRKLCTQLA